MSPVDPAILPLIERHLQLMYASSPACSVHAMDGDRLAEAGARFFAAFDDKEAVAMGALQPLSGSAAELKSMHVRSDKRGCGLADKILAAVIGAAREAGIDRLNLETGSQDAFVPARAFYARHGFSLCPPFEGYVEDPNSVFMSRAL